MLTTDYIIILLYLTGMILLSIFVGRRQKNKEDYYLGGRKIRLLGVVSRLRHW